MAKQPTKAALLKQAANETNTARAAHLRRLADGAGPLTALTKKPDQKRKEREALIKGLPPIKPVIEKHDGPREPHSNDIAVLQKQVDDLKADTVDLSGQLADAQKASEDAAADHTKVLEDVQREHAKTLANRDGSIAGLTSDVEARDNAIETYKAALAEANEAVKGAAEQAELSAAAHTEALAERDNQIEALQAAQSTDAKAGAKADADDEEPFD